MSGKITALVFMDEVVIKKSTFYNRARAYGARK